MNEGEMMEMPEYAAAVRLPLHDRPRLRLADALDPRWPARAAKIRIGLLDHRLRYLQPPFQGLALKHLLLFDQELKGLTRPDFGIPVRRNGWHRGLVGFLELQAADLLADNLRTLERFPITCLVVVDCTVEDLRRLAVRPELGQLVALGIKAPAVGDQGLRVFLDSPHLGTLRDLSFDDANLTMEGYEALAEATRTTLRGLEVGFLRGNTIDDPQEIQPSYDGYSGYPVHETVGVLPTAGRVLEENLGYQKWLHWCSRFGPEYTHSIFERPLDMDETPITLEEALGQS